LTIIDFLLHVQNSEIVRTRDRSAEAENQNCTRREETFDNFTLRVSSQFEHVKSEISTQMNELLNDQIAHVLDRVDSASRRRDRSRESERARKRDREREQREKQRERQRERQQEKKMIFIQKTEQS
jgi:ATP-dependent RNA helicase DDX46/PRP5